MSEENNTPLEEDTTAADINIEEFAGDALSEEIKNDAVRPEYVEKLKKESIKWRQKAKATIKEKEEVESSLTAAEQKAQEALTRIDQMTRQTEDRLVNSELRVAATNIGLIDMDCAKLADLSGVQVHENGMVTGVEEALKSLKDSKPYLFTGATTSQPFASPRPVSETKTKLAKDMTKEEYKKAEKEYIKNAGKR